jgi:hypothetical protein
MVTVIVMVGIAAASIVAVGIAKARDNVIRVEVDILDTHTVEGVGGL